MGRILSPTHGFPLNKLPEDHPHWHFLEREADVVIFNKVRYRRERYFENSKLLRTSRDENDVKKGIIRGTVFLYALIDQALRTRGCKIPTQTELEYIIKDGKYQRELEDSSISSSLVFRSILRSRDHPNYYLTRDFNKQIKEIKEGNFRFPQMISLSGMKPKRLPGTYYEISFDITGAEIDYAPKLSHKNGLVSFSEIDKNKGLPKKVFNLRGGKRILQTRENGLAVLSLINGRHLNSHEDHLVMRGHNDKIVYIEGGI